MRRIGQRDQDRATQLSPSPQPLAFRHQKPDREAAIPERRPATSPAGELGRLIAAPPVENSRAAPRIC